MDSDSVTPNGVFVIILFLVIGLIVMGCMFYVNWIHRKQRFVNTTIDDEVNNKTNACIYEKNNRSTYNRSSNHNLFLSFFFHIHMSLITYYKSLKNEKQKHNKTRTANCLQYSLKNTNNKQIFDFFCAFTLTSSLMFSSFVLQHR